MPSITLAIFRPESQSKRRRAFISFPSHPEPIWGTCFLGGQTPPSVAIISNRHKSRYFSLILAASLLLQ
jgi:hypothetical protein